MSLHVYSNIIIMVVDYYSTLSLSTVVLNSRDRKEMYGFHKNAPG